MADLITEHIHIWTAAQKQKINGSRGRGKKSNGQSPHGIKKLRELILELAVRGKLVPQDPNDEPANVLLEKITAQKARLVQEGKIKKQKPLPKISGKEEPFELPKGWSWVRLVEIGVWAIGSGFPKKEQGFEGLEILFSKVSDMNLEGNEKYIFKTVNTISKKTASKLRIHVQPEGTVIFPKIGGAIATNKRRIIVKPTAIDNNCLGITPMAGFDTAYLYLYLSSLDLTEYQAGTSVPALSQGTLELISLGLPPLAEQHRIVAKVEELMALCDQLEPQQTDSNATHQTLVENLLATLTTATDQRDLAKTWQRIAKHFDALFTTEQSIDHFKQTILQLAVMGKLIPQDPNDEPAIVLLGQIAKEKARLIKEGKIKKQKPLPEIIENEKPFDLPKGWEWAYVDECFSLKSGTSFNKEKELVSGQYIYAKVADMNLEGNEVDITTSSRFIDPSSKDLNAIIPAGSIVFPKRGGAIATNKKRFVKNNLFVDLNIMAITPFEGVNLDFAYRWLLGIDLAILNSGTSVPQINNKDIAPLLFPIPPLREQHRIVAKVDELMTLCGALKDRLEDAQTTRVQLADALVEQAVA